MPTLTEMLHKKSRAVNQMQKGQLYEQMSKRYGGVQAMFATMGLVILALTGTFLPKQVARVLNR